LLEVAGKGGYLSPVVMPHAPGPHKIASGVPVHIVAARLGDSPTEILKTYAHLLPQSDELAAERIAAALAGVA
jgi:hypothetical protein